MANEINGNLGIPAQRIGLPKQVAGSGAIEGAEGAQGTSFKDMLVKSLEQVNSMQQDADVAFQKLATGQTQNVTEVFSAVQKADLAFKTLMQIRNKLVDAYDDIRQMRI
jgi:flagellar hook-basal body complex protein FliE